MKNINKAYFAGGCFWCTEAIFSRLKGVIEVFPGYAGGGVVNPKYKQVCLGVTGHAEAVEIIFDKDTNIVFNRQQNLFDIFLENTKIDLTKNKLFNNSL